jgi:hypothetical protein
MKICAEVGIDIRHKAIWYDRKTILDGLMDLGLKLWLQQQQ